MSLPHGQLIHSNAVIPASWFVEFNNNAPGQGARSYLLRLESELRKEAQHRSDAATMAGNSNRIISQALSSRATQQRNRGDPDAGDLQIGGCSTYPTHSAADRKLDEMHQ